MLFFFGFYFIEKYILLFGGIDIKFGLEFFLLVMLFRFNVKFFFVGYFIIFKVWFIGCGLNMINVFVLLYLIFIVLNDILGMVVKWVSFRVGVLGFGERGILGEFL